MLFLLFPIAWVALLGAAWLLLDRGLSAQVQAARPQSDPKRVRNTPSVPYALPALIGLALLFSACRDAGSAAPAASGVSDSAAQTAPALHEDRYGITWALPEMAVTGKPLALGYRPVMADGAPVAALDTVHDRLSHLIIVSRDLSFFDHVHATRQPDGAFSLPYTFATGGPYVLFADYTPRGGTTQVFLQEMGVAGAGRPEQPLGPATAEATDRGLSVKIGLPESGLKAGGHLSLRFTVRDAAGPVSDLQQYLGASGHVVVIPEGASGFLHVHPEEAMGGGHAEGAGGHVHGSDAGAEAEGAPRFGPEIRFMTTFPSAGRYKLWLQVQRAGQVHTFPFVLDVAG